MTEYPNEHVLYAAIDEAIAADPNASARAIARKVGCSHPTVLKRMAKRDDPEPDAPAPAVDEPQTIEGRLTVLQDQTADFRREVDEHRREVAKINGRWNELWEQAQELYAAGGLLYNAVWQIQNELEEAKQ